MARQDSVLRCGAAVTLALAVVAIASSGQAQGPTGDLLASAPAARENAERHPRPARPTDRLAPAELKAEAMRLMAACQARYETIRDYTCTLYKRERIGRRLTPQYVMAMKTRTEPLSHYLKFLKPRPGREAIWVEDQHQGRVLVHDVGLGKLLAGTLALDPRGPRAMVDCRHPITEAGLGRLIDMVITHWERELAPDDSNATVAIHRGPRVGDRPCTQIICTHPEFRSDALFHSVQLYIDQELGLPIRFEAYDWPRSPGRPPELVEEYTYADLRVNVGLSALDFDPNNDEYAFGRF